MARTRAPRGYRIEQWADGFYHVYKHGGCIGEYLSRNEALQVAIDDAAQRNSDRTRAMFAGDVPAGKVVQS